MEAGGSPEWGLGEGMKDWEGTEVLGWGEAARRSEGMGPAVVG